MEKLFAGEFGYYESVSFYESPAYLEWLFKNIKQWDLDRHYNEMCEQVKINLDRNLHDR